MLRIRLQRSGRKKRPNYRIVVAEHSAPIKGRYIDMIGTFDPLIEKHGLVVDTAKVEEWIKKGAKPTNTVARLLKGQGSKGMEPFIIEMKDRKVKNPKEEPEKQVVAAPASEATESGTDAGEEAPAAEAPAEVDKPTEADKPADAPSETAAEEASANEAPDEEDKKEEEKPAEEASSKEDVPEVADDKKENAPAEESAPAEGEEASEDK